MCEYLGARELPLTDWSESTLPSTSSTVPRDLLFPLPPGWSYHKSRLHSASYIALDFGMVRQVGLLLHSRGRHPMHMTCTLTAEPPRPRSALLASAISPSVDSSEADAFAIDDLLRLEAS